MTDIRELKENGQINIIATYSCDRKKSLVNYIMQYIRDNWNTWEYPEIIDGMRQDKYGNWYYDKEKTLLASSR